MKYQCKCFLRDYLSQWLAAARKEAGLTQARFSELLMMDTRSYADLEHAQSLCCMLTFILYLCFCARMSKGWFPSCDKSRSTSIPRRGLRADSIGRYNLTPAVA